MAWTTPRTWVAGEIVRAATMNEHVRDNLSALRDEAATDRTNASATYPARLMVDGYSGTDAERLNAAISAAATTGGPTEIILPPRTMTLAADVTMSSLTGVVLRGEPGRSVLTRDTDSTDILFVTACADIMIEGVTFDCLGTAAGLIRTGLRVANSQRVSVAGCTFANHRVKGVYGGGLTGFTVSGCTFTGGWREAYDSSGADIYIENSSVVRAASNQHTAAAGGTGIGRAFIAVGDTTAGWAINDIVVRDCTVHSGYTRHGIGATHENQDTNLTSGDITIAGNRIKGCVEQGIKLKNVRRAVVTGNHISGCNTTEEGTSLRGGIFLNATEDAVCTGNIVRDDGTEGIRTEGLLTGGTAEGAGRGQHVISDNVVKDCAGDGVSVQQYTYETVVADNVVVRCRQGIYALGQNTTTEQRLRNLIIRGNVCRKNANSGVNASYADALIIEGNVLDSNGQYGAVVNLCTDLLLTGNIALDNGSSGTTFDGLRVSSTDGTIMGNRCRNRVGTNQKYGVSLGGTFTSLYLLHNDLDGNATSALSGTPTAKTGNRGSGANGDSLGYTGAVGFFTAAPTGKPTVTGARGSNAALTDLLSRLATLGLITDNTTA